MPRLLLVTATFVLMIPATYSGDDRMISARTEATKNQFLVGEPIELRVTITNSGSDHVDLAVDYPSFCVDDCGRVGFCLDGTMLEGRPVTAEEVARRRFGGTVPLVPIPPDGTWSTTIYLQRYTTSPEAGQYRLPYSLDLPYDTKPPGGEFQVLTARGDVSFSVVPATPEGLRDVLQGYTARLDCSDYWKRRAAIEALSVVEEPAVVPYLNHMFKIGFTDEALTALARFPKHEDARRMVVSALDSERFSVVGQALGVLAEWKYELEPHTLGILRKRDHPQIQEAVLRYVGAIEGANHQR